MLRRGFPFALTGSVSVACTLAFAVRDVLPAGPLLAWIGAMLLAACCRLGAMLYFDRHRRVSGARDRWLRHMFIGNLVSGVLWGFPLGYWTLFVELQYQLFFIVILIGLGTGVIFSNYLVLRVVYAFEIPAFVPPFVALAFQPSAINFAMVVGGACYLVATIVFVRRMNATHINALRVGYENQALVDQVRKEKEAAERSDLEKSRFLAAASHDLRQPVHAMSLFLGLLGAETLSDRSRYLVDNVSRAAESMGNLFDALLNISRLDAGVVHPRRRIFAIGEMLEQIGREYSLQAAQRGLRLRVRPCAALAYSDPALLERIVRNLVSNAIQHTDSGGVMVGCRRTGASLRVEVWDTGPGIPPEEQERIFWEFHQLRNPERDRSKGLGLGLAIVRRTAALLGHPLSLGSRVGKGSVFRLGVGSGELAAALPPPPVPVSRASVPVGAALSASDNPVRQARRHEAKLIVVIDDDVQIREGLDLLLQSWGYIVLSAASGAELMERLTPRPDRPALIISDYRLRERETGFEVIERVREEYNCGIPALLISGDTDPQRLIEAANQTLTLLHKPVAVATLRGWVQHLLSEDAEGEIAAGAPHAL